MTTENKKVHRGEYIREKLQSYGWTLQLLADTLGSGKSTVYRMLQKEDLKFHKMKAIADVLGFDLREDFPAAAFLYKGEMKKESEMDRAELEKMVYQLKGQVAVLQEKVEKYESKPGQNRDSEE